MNDKTCHIRELFPDKTPRIDLLLAKDPEFLALSEDYDACVDALRYWTESQAPEAHARVSEYRGLVQELEEEIALVLIAPDRRRSD